MPRPMEHYKAAEVLLDQLEVFVQNPKNQVTGNGAAIVAAIASLTKATLANARFARRLEDKPSD